MGIERIRTIIIDFVVHLRVLGVGPRNFGREFGRHPLQAERSHAEDRVALDLHLGGDLGDQDAAFGIRHRHREALLEQGRRHHQPELRRVVPALVHGDRLVGDQRQRLAARLRVEPDAGRIVLVCIHLSGTSEDLAVVAP